MRLSRTNNEDRAGQLEDGPSAVPGEQRPAGGWLRHLAEPTPGWVAPVWSALTVVPAIGRAQDYLTRDDAGPLTVGVEVLGFHRWGWTFASVVVLVLIGLAVTNRSRWPIVVAHTWAGAVHTSYVVALAGEVAGSGRGWGVLLLPVGGLLAHVFAVALYLGPRRTR